MNLLPSLNFLLRAFLLMVLAGAGCAERQALDSNVALSGTVSSADEGLMEGVVVILRNLNSTVLTAVTSDSAGHFQFNQDRVTGGDYEISVRAVGYELLGAKIIVIDEKQSQILGDLILTSVIEPLRLASQLTSLDWVKSFP